MFVVVHLEATPEHLRGYLGRFLVEVSVGLHVGTLSPKVADALWARVTQTRGAGRVAMIRSDARSESGYRIALHGHEAPGRGRARDIVELDGLELIREHLLVSEATGMHGKVNEYGRVDAGNS